MSQLVDATNLTAEILTSKMPLSDAFDQSQSAKTKVGIHDGFNMTYTGTNWPMKQVVASDTRTLRISAGKLVMQAGVPLDQSQTATLLTVVLESDLDIDLESLTSPILGSDNTVYLIGIQSTYTPAEVDETGYPGLISTNTINDLKIMIKADSSTGFDSDDVYMLGKFSRGQMMIVKTAETPLRSSKVTLKDSTIASPNGLYENTSAANFTEFRNAVGVDHYADVSKRVNITGLNSNDFTNLETIFNSVYMPLSSITTSVATAVGHIDLWTKALDWTNTTPAIVYQTGRVWKDVRCFEVHNCYFREDIQLAFHRTPGHAKLQSMTDAQIRDRANISVLTDYGNDGFIFDGKGSIFAGDLTIDLVLDFTGNAHDRIFNVEIKNLRVGGTLTINYGQSRLGIAGGSLATITYDNVQSQVNLLRPWPQVSGVDNSSAITGGGWSGSTVLDVVNNAGNMIGSTPATWPKVLTYWQSQIANGFNDLHTIGVLVPAYLYDSLSYTSPPSMGDPWLNLGVDGCIIFKNSTLVLTDLLGAAINASGAEVHGVPPNDRWDEAIRVQIISCVKDIINPSPGSYGYNEVQTFRMVDNAVLTVAEYDDDDWDTVNLTDLLVSGGGSGNITADNIFANNQLRCDEFWVEDTGSGSPWNNHGRVNCVDVVASSAITTPSLSVGSFTDDGTNLNTLTDGSNADALHTHALGTFYKSGLDTSIRNYFTDTSTLQRIRNVGFATTRWEYRKIDPSAVPIEELFRFNFKKEAWMTKVTYSFQAKLKVNNSDDNFFEIDVYDNRTLVDSVKKVQTGDFPVADTYYTFSGDLDITSVSNGDIIEVIMFASIEIATAGLPTQINTAKEITLEASA